MLFILNNNIIYIYIIMLANFNAGFPPLKYKKNKESKESQKKSKNLNITNILNQNVKPMIITDKPVIDVIDNL